MIEQILTSVPGLTAVVAGSETQLVAHRAGANRAEISMSCADGRPGVLFEIDLGAAAGYWHPGGRGARPLPPDWAAPARTSMVQSAPAGALYDAAGTVLLAWAASDSVSELCVRCGVSEERKTFVVEVTAVRPRRSAIVIHLDASGGPLAPTVRRLARWLSTQCAGTPLPAPDVARLPVYSTWYTFTQEIDADFVAAEAALATKLGCGTVFIDDGWQQRANGRGYQGCGDWLPDARKFPNLAETVRAINDSGARVALWTAPLLLGRESQIFDTLAPTAPHWAPELNCHVLDPRHAAVREHVASTCLRLVRDYGADLLKIDFLDQAMAYGDTGDGDTADIGTAMAELLTMTRGALAEAGYRNVALEFRQPYVSPAIARFGEILRANDCPGDSYVNRVATVEARLFSVGQVIHSDPMMWGRSGGAEAVAQQLYSGWFAVPQVSMRLSELTDVQAGALQGLLRLWRDLADVTQHGTLEVSGAERGYDLVRAYRPDLARAVVAIHAPVVVDLDPASSTTILNGTRDRRLVVRTPGPITGGTVRAADAQPIAAVPATTPGGLVELKVPAFGSITVHT